jgi:hypothetical protein
LTSVIIARAVDKLEKKEKDQGQRLGKQNYDHNNTYMKIHNETHYFE